MFKLLKIVPTIHRDVIMLEYERERARCLTRMPFVNAASLLAHLRKLARAIDQHGDDEKDNQPRYPELPSMFPPPASSAHWVNQPI